MFCRDVLHNFIYMKVLQECSGKSAQFSINWSVFLRPFINDFSGHSREVNCWTFSHCINARVLGAMAKWLRCWIPNPVVPSPKPLGGSKVDSAFILLKSIKWVPEISGDLVVKNKLPPQSGSSLEAVEPHP